MKLCTKIRVAASQPAGGVFVTGDVDVIDVSFVDDGHQFGVDEDGCLHVEGRIEGISPAAAPS